MLSTAISCKKEQVPNPNVVYEQVNMRIRAAEKKTITLDIDRNGTPDYQFFFELNASDTGDHQNVLVNPIGLNSARMEAPNDNNYLNAGELIAQRPSSITSEQLGENGLWGSDFATLAIRHTAISGKVTYTGDWASSKPQFMAIRLMVDGAAHFGWVKIGFNKSTEEITVYDYAWNREANAQIRVGLTSF